MSEVLDKLTGTLDVPAYEERHVPAPTPKLNKAAATARAEMKNPEFDSVNPHFNSKFASLKSVINATVPVFAKHGIAVHQDIQTTRDGIACYTYLCHDSGEERVYGPLVVRATKSDAQGQGSAASYARRYHLQSIAAVSGEEDDDGNAAVRKPKEMSQAQAGKIAALLDNADLETGEGVDAFGEAWLEMDAEDQKTFAPWITKFYPGQVSAKKALMHDIMRAYRERRNDS